MYWLPKIEIKKFNGDLTEWLNFWSQFQKIHEDPDLHDSDKFQYLVQAVEPGTRAHRLIQSYPQTAANYPKVIEAMTDRFGDKVLLAEVYVRQLLKLVTASTKGETTHALATLYDQLESHLRALETLDVTTDQSAIFLYPLIESSLPEDIISVWQRSSLSGYGDGETDVPVADRLQSLMHFLRKEVKGAERLSIVRARRDDNPKNKKKPTSAKNVLPQTEPECATAAGLLTTQSSTCVFCTKTHESKECIKAQNMTIDQKREKVQKANACFRCLKFGHSAKKCKSVVKCILCKRRHLTLMCPDIAQEQTKDPEAKNIRGNENTIPEKVTQNTQNMFSNSNQPSEFLLQTLLVQIKCRDKYKLVRALCDSGSQRSYILRTTVEELGLHATSSQNLCHMLFGGSQECRHHEIYEIEVCSTTNSSCMTMEVLDHQQICRSVPKLSRGPWMNELKKHGIFISDLQNGSSEIELLIGADYYANLITGRKIELPNGLVAMETTLGWTLSGRVVRKSKSQGSSLALATISMHVLDAQIKVLWDLETIGIRDPVEVLTREEQALNRKQQFFDTIDRKEDGRYIVPLPWVSDHPKIPDNKMIAEKRLLCTSRKLVKLGLLGAYDTVMNSWQEGEFIEKLSSNCETGGHYLPHRAVLRPSSTTTPLRPVFDASCQTPRSPSLNNCLEKGVNLLELLPNVLLRFREKPIGVTADIKKAFQMIEIAEEDRDYLKFLWWEDYDTRKMTTFRHKRVVFGLTCSPFILGAVIEYHLRHVPAKDQETAATLLKAFYVDNCTTSVHNEAEYDQFKTNATRVMVSAQMELCRWERTLHQTKMVDKSDRTEVADNSKENTPLSSVLGLGWDKLEDSLYVEVPDVDRGIRITKRTVLSFISKIFDPIGVTCPALLPMKLILQKTWAIQLGWDEDLPDPGKHIYTDWQRELGYLRTLNIPRNITGGTMSYRNPQLHIFSDASQEAYAAVIYLRTENPNDVHVQLLAAKTRVAPMKRPTIPRLELLGCVVAARLANQVRNALTIPNITTCYWSDSTTAIAWIRRHEAWGTFVNNRVKEIRQLTTPAEWRHVPGALNPADLPSRGCTPKQLVESGWWEGPPWLTESPQKWPTSHIQVNEEEVAGEKLKGPIQVESMSAVTTEPWYTKPFSSYIRNVRLVAWIKRFVSNLRGNRTSGPLTYEEINQTEMFLFGLVQSETFSKKSVVLKQLNIRKDKDGILRVGTKLFHVDGDFFRSPILLPGTHPLVAQLIRHEHLQSGHAGVQFLMSSLRERFWILRARQTIRRVLRQCKQCLRFTAKGYSPDPAGLPENRVSATAAFEVVGIDLAGPLFLKKGQKAWIVLFTCAVFRCVHLDWVLSLSTEAFLEALQRFISSCGRPKIIYSDNGTNFTGANNAFQQLNWRQIEEHSSVQRIKWIFNPPAASWWGGWWERLIRTTKDLLKRMLGRARITSEELRTCLAVVEAALNNRPLTTVTEDVNDLIPLTPAMFLRGIKSSEFPEYQELNSKQLQAEYHRKQKILEELQTRFRKEYLSQLVQRTHEVVNIPAVGDVVLVGQDNKKRVEWPLARVVELFPGKDDKVRVARVKTTSGTLTRPIQKLYPLEVQTPSDFVITKEARQVALNEDKMNKMQRIDVIPEQPRRTRYGRLVKQPVKYRAF